MGTVHVTERFGEVDALRGAAVLMMIVYHTLFDLDFLGVLDLDMGSPVIWFTGRLTAFLFIFLVGVSLSLSHSRRGVTSSRHYIIRGLKIFLWGMVITAATWIYPHNGFIAFGVLHFIGLAVILTHPLAGRRTAALALSAVAITVGVLMSGLRVETPLLMWLGIRPYNLYTLDYFPLFPWLGVVLLGIFTGDTLYPGYRRRFGLRAWSPSLLQLIGRNSLKVYLVHQPVIVGIIWAAMYLTS